MDDNQHGALADAVSRRAWVRQQQLIAAIERYAPSYHRVTGNSARYVAEITNASRDERDWIANHIRNNPQVLAGPELTDNEWKQRHQQRADAAFARADTAFRAGDYTAALDHIDQAEVYQPEGWAPPGRPLIAWDELRNDIRNKQRQQRTTPHTNTTPRTAASRPVPTAAAHTSTTATTAPSAGQAARPDTRAPRR